MTQRKYQLRRLRKGDYLLPGNDGKTLWRIHRYMDGPSSGLDIPRDRYFWCLDRWKLGINDFAWTIEHQDDMTLWVCSGQMLDSRAEAIEAAIGEQL